MQNYSFFKKYYTGDTVCYDEQVYSARRPTRFHFLGNEKYWKDEGMLADYYYVKVIDRATQESIQIYDGFMRTAAGKEELESLRNLLTKTEN